MNKIIITVSLGLLAITAQSQVQFGQKESFSISPYVDPVASIQENGLNIGFDVEYRGSIYARAGFESFSALAGNYKDIHFGVGPRLTFGLEEQWSAYVGGRIGVAFRNEASNAIGGFEGGVDYTFNNGLLIGLNASYIYRGDMKAMGWMEIWRENGYVKVGYSWDWK